jgi:hypothetical protein
VPTPINPALCLFAGARSTALYLADFLRPHQDLIRVYFTLDNLVRF